MLKGITAVIATILLVLITVSIVGFAFMWFGRVSSMVSSMTENQTINVVQQMGAKAKIDSFDSKNYIVYLRNTGTVAITKPAFYIDEQFISFTGPTLLEPGNIGAYSLNSTQLSSFSGDVLLKISIEGGSSSTKIVNIKPVDIDVLSYFLSDHPEIMLTGTHPMNFKQVGQKAFYTKWSSDSYEIYEWDNQYIYLREDHSGSPVSNSYTFNPGIWLKRYMKVGEEIDVSMNIIQNYNSLCNPTTSQSFPYKMKLEQNIPYYNLGGDLGTEDVIVILYNYSGPGFNRYERSYYSKEWGFVKWEEYRDNVIAYSSIFNNISSQPPIQPDIGSSCTYIQ